MNRSITFHPCTEDDARYVGARLREQDRLELERALGTDPVQEAVRSLAASIIAWTMVSPSGHPMAIFGVSPHPTLYGVGGVWLVGTEEVNHAGKTLVQKGRYYVGLMAKLFPIALINYVDVENTRTRAWLRHLGFVEEPRIVTSRRGFPFVPVSFTKDLHVQRSVPDDGIGRDQCNRSGEAVPE